MKNFRIKINYESDIIEAENEQMAVENWCEVMADNQIEFENLIEVEEEFEGLQKIVKDKLENTNNGNC